MSEPRIMIEFVGGGDWDGKILDSHSADIIEAQMARHYYDFTNQGKQGHAFHGVSMGKCEQMYRDNLRVADIKLQPGMSHKYTVIEKIVESNEILVRIAYSVWDRRNLDGD